MAVGPRQIQEAREALGETQAAFGLRFGVDQSTIHRWETDGPPARGPAAILIESLLDSLAGARIAS